MHRIAFPSNLNIGTDIVYLPRIRRLISRQEGRSLIPFARRILHPLEIRDLSLRHPQWQARHEKTYANLDSLIKWLGGRFAAKEAARKAMGATTLGWKDVRVDIAARTGQPRVICATRDINNQDIEHEAKLSISHDGDYVVATVLVAGLPETVDTAISKALADHERP
jgi:holo-[acyl-carrier protein] synthase